MMRDIMEVPLPRACSRRLMSFFTFQISIFFSASLACGALMVSEGGEYCHSKNRPDLWQWYDEYRDQSACGQLGMKVSYTLIAVGFSRVIFGGFGGQAWQG